MHVPAAVDWSAIDNVLLDMDGTLLDLRFDNWFWQEHIPSHYAAANGIGIEQACAVLRPKFRASMGTIQWYCIDHWTRELGLDVLQLKRAAGRQVRFLPGAEEFLLNLAALGKRRVLVTNAHPQTLAIKNEHVDLQRHFDASFSAHLLAAAKEDPAFWPRLRRLEPFDPARTLFVDDNLAVLRSARDYGIAWLRAVRYPDSAGAVNDSGEFAGIDRVADLI